MLFQSVDFLVFLLVVFAAYWLLPRREQNILLLFGSYFFYGYVHPWFSLLLGTSTLIDYVCALGMDAYPRRKRALLSLSLATNLGMLGLFKYFDFFVESVGAVLSDLGISQGTDLSLHLLLPVGISFYTFQTLSYTIDVYRGHLKARRNFLDYAVFVSFFPQLVAGPIERASHLLAEFERDRRLEPHAFNSGVLLVVWGFFKKLVVADNVGLIANRVFALEHVSFPILWAGVFAFGIQIYADFSGYSDIARGVARLFGVELLQNFRHPYLARGPADFWHRWHISLSTWFRDYVYIPLGGSRVGSRSRQARNIMVTFLLSGLWHGASWNFVLWGAYWGALLVAGRGLGMRLPKLSQCPWLVPLRVLFTFMLAHLGWLIFREQELDHLARKLGADPRSASEFEWRAGLYLGFTVLVSSLPLWAHALYDEWNTHRRAPIRPWSIGGPALVAFLLWAILVFRAPGSLDFIYFQF